MPDLAQVRVLPAQDRSASSQLRHAGVVRLTHWIHTLAFLAMVISGVAILLAHPRLYWGNTGAFGSPALLELPLPLNLDQSGWGRSLHFLSAWICVINGAVYIAFGLASRHFKANLLPESADLGSGAIRRKISDVFHLRKPDARESVKYNAVQQLTYLTVVFVLFPLMILTGLAMSPAVTAALPVTVEIFGGYQSARTVHFVITNLLLLFLVLHIAMLCMAGFWNRTRAMITGYNATKERI
jgi:thiosulfate reductase cytochrome b subunit